MTPSMPEPTNAEEYALSVLLHDLGKLWERCSDAPQPTPAEIDEFCPAAQTSQGRSHTHAAFSARAIREFVGADAGGIARWGPRHHKPDPTSRGELCAHLADLLAGGALALDESREVQATGATPLRRFGITDRALFFPLLRRDQTLDALFPRPVVPLSREDYRYFWIHLLRALDQRGLPVRRLADWMEILERFAARVPAASTNRQLAEIADVDLHAHSWAVAAIAVALHQGPWSAVQLKDLAAQLFSRKSVWETRPPAVLWRAVPLPGGSLKAGEICELLVAKLGVAATSVFEAHDRAVVALLPANSDTDPLRDALRSCGACAVHRPVTLADFRSGLAPLWAALENDAARTAQTAALEQARSERERFWEPFTPVVRPTELVATIENGAEASLLLQIERDPLSLAAGLPAEGANLPRLLARQRDVRWFLEDWFASHIALRFPALSCAEPCGVGRVALRGPAVPLLEFFEAFSKHCVEALPQPGLWFWGALVLPGESLASRDLETIAEELRRMELQKRRAGSLRARGSWHSLADFPSLRVSLSAGLKGENEPVDARDLHTLWAHRRVEERSRSGNNASLVARRDCLRRALQALED